MTIIIKIDTKGSEEEFELQSTDSSENEMGIGRSPDNQLSMSSSTVSNYHARINYEGDEVILYDLNSATGTFVNKQPISRHVLNIDDSIVIGNQELVFVGFTEQSPDNSKNAENETSDLVSSSEAHSDNQSPGEISETVSSTDDFSSLVSSSDNDSAKHESTESSDDSQKPEKEPPTLIASSEVDTGLEQPEDPSDDELRRPISATGSKVDNPEHSEDEIDIVEPWAHLDIANETDQQESELQQTNQAATEDTDTTDDEMQVASSGTDFEQYEQSKQQTSTESNVTHLTEESCLNESPVEEDNSLEDVVEILAGAVDEIDPSSDLMAIEPAIEVTSIPVDDSGMVPDAPESDLSPDIKVIESSVPASLELVDEQEVKPAEQKTIDQETGDSAGRRTIQLKRPSIFNKPIELDFELPAPIDPTHTTKENDQNQGDDASYSSTTPDLFRNTSDEPVVIKENKPTKSKSRKRQTTLEIVPPSIAQNTETASQADRAEKANSSISNKPNTTHLIVQAGPNVGNRATLTHNRTVLGINGHRCLAVVRDKNNYVVSSLDKNVPVRINGVPLDIDSLPMKDGDSVEFFDVRMRFVA